MRIALCHEWLTTYGGSEQVAQRIASALGVTDVFTFTADPDMAARLFPDVSVSIAHPIGRSALARDHWQWLLPLMPHAWRSLDLNDFDVVVTSSHCSTNAVQVRGDALHVSYCHTPMRYAWQWRSEIGRFPRAVRPLWPAAASALRRSDRASAANVDVFVANSRYVADRIRSAYDRPATVIHPPVATDFWTPDLSQPKEDFFLYAGRLVPYKRPDLAVEAAEKAGVRLIVAGAGPEERRLRASAGNNVEFVSDASDEELRDLYRRAQALVFAGVEDFGMTLVEAQACGTPVIALGRGGAREAVRDGLTGLLYEDASAKGLADAIGTFNAGDYSVVALRRHATRFSHARFETAFRNLVETSVVGERRGREADRSRAVEWLQAVRRRSRTLQRGRSNRVVGELPSSVSGIDREKVHGDV